MYKYDIFNKKWRGYKELRPISRSKIEEKQVGLVEKLGKQGFHNDVKEIFEPITKAVTDSNHKLLEETNPLQKQWRNWMNQMLMWKF